MGIPTAEVEGSAPQEGEQEVKDALGRSKRSITSLSMWMAVVNWQNTSNNGRISEVSVAISNRINDKQYLLSQT